MTLAIVLRLAPRLTLVRATVHLSSIIAHRNLAIPSFVTGRQFLIPRVEIIYPANRTHPAGWLIINRAGIGKQVGAP
ncbi:hypothetical protein RSAG8_12228, partial [Rhizoctonia solani AG-8 WAC10335]